MAIPYHRYVRYTDDGCGIEQCLNCKATWEWRGGSGIVRFCMYCGVQFKGQLECRDQDTPRWQYDLRRQLGDEVYWRIERQWDERRWTTACKRPCWVIQERTFWLKRDGTVDHLLHEWHSKRRLNHCGSAHEAFSYLQATRKEEAEQDTPDDPDYDPQFDAPRFSRSEYRVRREPA